ncbi:unnamed protein product [Boreogadus saida]
MLPTTRHGHTKNTTVTHLYYNTRSAGASLYNAATGSMIHQADGRRYELWRVSPEPSDVGDCVRSRWGDMRLAQSYLDVEGGEPIATKLPDPQNISDLFLPPHVDLWVGLVV